MINLMVVSLRGAPLGRPVSAQFGPAGGTIGRAVTNTLVLDDPDRTVSRVHAQVQCRDGQFVVVDRGANPLLHNGRALGSGNEAVLAAGDRLMIGSFELAVQVAAAEGAPSPRAPSAAPLAKVVAPSDDDPFADLLAGLGPVATPPDARAAPSSAPRPGVGRVAAVSGPDAIGNPQGRCRA